MGLLVDLLGGGAGISALAVARRGRRRGGGVRLLIEPYRNDRASAASLAAAFTALHALLGPRRTLALEVHLDRRAGGAPLVWFAVICPPGLQRQVQAALRSSYPNARLRQLRSEPSALPFALALRRRSPPRALDDPVECAARIDGLLAAMAAAGAPATLRLILRPAPALIEHLRSSPESDAGPLFWALPVVAGRDAAGARSIASALCGGSPRLVARRRARSDRLRVARSPRHLYRPTELTGLWCLPAPEFGALPYVRHALPLAPAPPGIRRPRGGGLLRDEHGPITIAPEQRRQHTAVVGAVDQGKTSFLVASAREDLRRDDCALIVLDPKGDAAAAVLSIVPPSRVCTLLDMAAPRAGFNPLAAAAPPDAVADQVVAALRGLFGEGEVRGSSDRYLRNAIVAVLACEPSATLWDVARLLEVGESGGAFRARVADRLVEQPSYAELATFLAHELPAQLSDARATTTAKLDAPANKLARVLNSPAVKRVLLNDSLTIDFDRLIERREVLVVRGALGEIGAGNVAVLMQLLLGMLDAALSRVQDRRDARERRAVALKVDEAPLAINAAFAQTLALKRSAGLETVACWQTDAQWEPELREQLDALFAHRVLFATASSADARSASALLMSEFSDQIRAGDEQLARLFSPDVRLHLPRHAALASWTTSRGRERPFIARTMPLALDRERIDWHARAQHARGGRELVEPAPPPSPFEPPDRAAPTAATAPRPPMAVAHPAAQSPSVPLQSGSAARLASPYVAPQSGSAAPMLSPSVLPPSGSPAAPASPYVASQSGSAAPMPSPSVPLQAGSAAVVASSSASVPPSYADLVALDRASRMRLLPPPRRVGAPRLSADDRELLEWLAGARCALSSQIHRRFNASRSLTVTQRQLKRLADAGLIARFQLHRDDGGGLPICCAVSDAAIELLGLSGRRAPELSDDALPALRATVHLVGWLLALEARAGDAMVEVLGPGRAAIVPGVREPSELDLGTGLLARDFLASAGGGTRAPVARFAPVRPGAIVSLRLNGALADGRGDLLVVAEDIDWPAAVEACDHLLCGWWRSVERYRRSGGPPAVVFVCAGRPQAIERASAADSLLSACVARIGVEPASWQRAGRAGIHFAAEEDLHRGQLSAWRVPALPPTLRERDECELLRSTFLQLPPCEDRSGPKVPWR